MNPFCIPLAIEQQKAYRNDASISGSYQVLWAEDGGIVDAAGTPCPNFCQGDSCRLSIDDGGNSVFATCDVVPDIGCVD
jgi:hypothetical protein